QSLNIPDGGHQRLGRFLFIKGVNKLVKVFECIIQVLDDFLERESLKSPLQLLKRSGDAGNLRVVVALVPPHIYGRLVRKKVEGKHQLAGDNALELELGPETFIDSNFDRVSIP